MARRRPSGFGGIGGILVVAGVLYFTGGGAWLLDRLKDLGANCYTLMAKVEGQSVSGPVCSGLAKSIAFVDNSSLYLGRQIESVRMYFDRTEEGFDGTLDATARRITALASSSQDLKRMFERGPYVGAATPADQFKVAIDSFAIGNSYLTNRATTQVALPWLNLSANQPMGYGLMSQLSLGRVYATGHGVPQDYSAAAANYQRARQSLMMLMQSGDPNARKLLNSLPVSPAVLQTQLETAIRELKFKVN